MAHAHIQIIAAAFHYLTETKPFYEVGSTSEPARGTGDSKYVATLALKNAGLIVERQGRTGVEFNATDGLRVYVEALEKVAFPKQKWQV